MLLAAAKPFKKTENWVRMVTWQLCRFHFEHFNLFVTRWVLQQIWNLNASILLQIFLQRKGNLELMQKYVFVPCLGVCWQLFFSRAHFDMIFLAITLAVHLILILIHSCIVCTFWEWLGTLTFMSQSLSDSLCCVWLSHQDSNPERLDDNYQHVLCASPTTLSWKWY